MGHDTGVPRHGQGHGALIGESLPIRAIRGVVKRAASVRAPVLIIGQEGVGKESVARSIHQSSDRCDEPFVVVDVATVAPELTMCDLSGREGVESTGSAQGLERCFAQADRGVIFLDNIEKMPMHLEAVLRRVLLEAAIRPLGSGKEVAIDVRVISAAQIDPAQLAREDRFRRRLYFWLSAVRIDVPPLRSRPEDIEPLVRHFFDALSSGKSLDSDALRALKGYRWPGNVRELRKVVEALSSAVQGDLIRLADLPEPIASATDSSPRPSPGDHTDGEGRDEAPRYR